MLDRIRVTFLIRKLRIDLGVPMRGWWWNIALPYIVTGRMPKLNPARWKLYLGEEENVSEAK